jgi:hypothetical protein
MCAKGSWIVHREHPTPNGLSASRTRQAGKEKEVELIGNSDQFNKPVSTNKMVKAEVRERKQPSWRDNASPKVLECVDKNVFSKKIGKELLKYDHKVQDIIAQQIENMTMRPTTEELLTNLSHLSSPLEIMFAFLPIDLLVLNGDIVSSVNIYRGQEWEQICGIAQWQCAGAALILKKWPACAEGRQV